MSKSSSFQTFKLWFEPDKDIPQFKRLRWSVEDVSIDDVLLNGIHPWQGEYKCLSLPNALVERINLNTAKMDDLSQFNLCWDLAVTKQRYSSYRYAQRESGEFEQTLETIRKDLVFVESLSYLQLLDIAKTRLHAMWSHNIAVSFLTNAFPVFNEQRQFLKKKDKSIKLTGRGDIDRYDLGGILSLEDFSDRDSLIISEGIPTQNFRLTSALNSFTDSQGRLRLLSEISHLTISGHMPDDDLHKTTTFVSWRVERKGRELRFRPELGNSVTKRDAAKQFAEKWRTDKGRYCFTSRVEKLDQILRERSIECSFPNLNYSRQEQEGGSSIVQVQPSFLQAWYVGAFPTDGLNSDTFKGILRDYGVPMTGNKDALIKKLANLAAEQYEKHYATIDGFFSTNRMIKIRQQPASAARLDILGHSAPDLQTLLVTMYILKHLRGEAILEPEHDNTAYSLDELAHALITRRVSLTGSFISVQ